MSLIIALLFFHSIMEDIEACCLCEEIGNGGELVTLGDKGLTGVVNASRRRGDNKWEELQTRDKIKIHKSCRKNYTRESSIQAAGKTKATEVPKSSPVKKKLRSFSDEFDFQTRCLFCAELCEEINPKTPVEKRRKFSRVMTLPFRNNLISECDKRNDGFGRKVKERVLSVLDLVAAEARYHHDCLPKFVSNISSWGSVGRPKNEELESSFIDVCNHLENADDCQHSLEELLQIMEVKYRPSAIVLKKKLKEKYGEDIIIADTKSKATVVCFRGTGNKILNEAWYSRKEQDEKLERLRIVKTAAAIVREDLTSVALETESYPAAAHFLEESDENIPETLKVFLSDVVTKNKKGKVETCKRKCEAIGNAIMAATRPQSFLSPILIAIAVYLHRKLGSKQVVEMLSHLGFCASYNEAVLFESSAVTNSSSCEETLDEKFIQFVFDNADFNVRTVDGFNTFHSMGGIMCVTPGNASRNENRIPRLKEIPSANSIAAHGKIMMKLYQASEDSGLRNITFEDFSVQEVNRVTDNLMFSNNDLMWMIGKFSSIPNLPSWSGYMSAVTQHMDYEKSHISFLPFVNHPPSNYDTINTVLHFAAEEGLKKGQSTIFVTFDQPLYIKAREIVTNAKADSNISSISVRLGGFHLLMSFLGCLGYIMDGSGLKELWETSYAPSSVEKMLTGHAFARAIRAHFITHLALGKLLLHEIEISEDIREEIQKQVCDFSNTPPKYEYIEQNNYLSQVRERMNETKCTLMTRGGTAQLWLKYFDLISITKKFIQAERMGDWNLHLKCIQIMIPIFYACGHFHYVKCAQLYLQDMINLESRLTPEEFKLFTEEGYFTIRRSDKFWAGVWSDMTVEQTLMRAMKMSGGLTHGRGTTDSVLTKWTLGMPVGCDISNQLENFTGMTSTAPEQHSDFRKANVKRDDKATEDFVRWFISHPPFPNQEKLFSIASGIVGNETINSHKAYEIGLEGIKKMVGSNFESLKFKRSDRVLSLANVNSNMRVHGTTVPVNTNLLFQRILSVLKNEDDLYQYFRYELAPMPTSLFDERGLRKTNKAALYSLFEPIPPEQYPKEGSDFVVDGGFLLHRVVWPTNSTFQTIFNAYVSYLTSHYGQHMTVVFDGYSELSTSTKTCERERRCFQEQSADVLFDETMIPTTKQEKFFSNFKNKARFITLLVPVLNNAGISVYQAPDDADTLVIKTAVDMSETHEYVTVVGEDVDLLILLVANAHQSNIYFLKPGRSKTPTRIFSLKEISDTTKSVIIENVLFLHAFCGCDTTSAIYGKGKMKSVNLLLKRDDLHSIVRVFNKADANPQEVSGAGERFMLALYGAPKEESSIDKYRFAVFTKLVAHSNKEVILSKLPPTSAAIHQHSLRVYLQVQKWRFHNLLPQNWGWESKGNTLVPIQSALPPAPDDLLHLISCNCVKGCDRRCGCVRAGLKCSKICGTCQGITCNNSRALDLQATVEDIDDSDVEDDVLCTMSPTPSYSVPTSNDNTMEEHLHNDICEYPDSDLQLPSCSHH